MIAELILKSTALFTGLHDTTQPGAIALADGRIIFVGTFEEAEDFRGPNTQVRDFGDAMITAGFHDSHLHFFQSALYSS
ncbi:MAG: amidohydrolase, partial [Raoultibacter sp.]